MTQMHPQSHIPQENPQQERDGETSKTLPAYISRAAPAAVRNSRAQPGISRHHQAGRGAVSACSRIAGTVQSVFRPIRAPQANESQTPSAGYVPQMGARTFAAGYTRPAAAGPSSHRRPELHGMQAQSAPSPTRLRHPVSVSFCPCGRRCSSRHRRRSQDLNPPFTKSLIEPPPT